MFFFTIFKLIFALSCIPSIHSTRRVRSISAINAPSSQVSNATNSNPNIGNNLSLTTTVAEDSKQRSKSNSSFITIAAVDDIPPVKCVACFATFDLNYSDDDNENNFAVNSSASNNPSDSVKSPAIICLTCTRDGKAPCKMLKSSHLPSINFQSIAQVSEILGTPIYCADCLTKSNCVKCPVCSAPRDVDAPFLFREGSRKFDQDINDAEAANLLNSTVSTSESTHTTAESLLVRYTNVERLALLYDRYGVNNVIYSAEASVRKIKYSIGMYLALMSGFGVYYVLHKLKEEDCTNPGTNLRDEECNENWSLVQCLVVDTVLIFWVCVCLLCTRPSKIYAAIAAQIRSVRAQETDIEYGDVADG